MDSKILVTRSSMPDLDEYVEEIRPIWDSHWLTNMGIKHKELQAELENYLGVRHVALYTNGHLALENAIAALNLPEGGEVITTPFTFASTTHAIVRNRLVPVFCDVNDRDYTMDVTKIESLISDRTVAIVPVHVYGNVCDVEAIEMIANKYGLKVIYDAAHAFRHMSALEYLCCDAQIVNTSVGAGTDDYLVDGNGVHLVDLIDGMCILRQMREGHGRP